MTVEDLQYKVVVNHEEQYALWIHGKENAPGWKDTSVTGTKSECLAYVNEVWSDMRPLSLRKAMGMRNPGNCYQPASFCQAA